MQKIVTQISKIFAVMMVLAFSVLMLELMIINAVLAVILVIQNIVSALTK